MTADIRGLRAQILANAKLMLKPTSIPSTSIAPSTGTASSQSTLINSHASNSITDLDIVVFGTPTEFTAAVMVGLTPAIEGAKASSPEAAIRKLFVATAEMLNELIPKVEAHHRNIHGGGVFDMDLISVEIEEAKKRA